jgi:hypothetical protein
MKWVFYNAHGAQYQFRWVKRSAKCKSAQKRGRAKAWESEVNERKSSAEGKNHHRLLKIIGNDRKLPQMSGNNRNWSAKVGIGHVMPVTCDAITWSAANGAKMRKYTNREPWGSSAHSCISRFASLIVTSITHRMHCKKLTLSHYRKGCSPTCTPQSASQVVCYIIDYFHWYSHCKCITASLRISLQLRSCS